METVAAIFGYAQPTKKQQLAKSRRMALREVFKIEREIVAWAKKKKTVTTWIENAEKRAATPARRAQAQRDIVTHSSSLKVVARQLKHLEMTKTRLESVITNINILEYNISTEKALRTAVHVTKEANKLGRSDLIGLQQSSGALFEELMRSDIMNDIYDETLAGATEEADPVMDAEIQATLDGILGPESSASEVLSTLPVPQKSIVEMPQEENVPREEHTPQEEDENPEALLGDLNRKLESLRN